MTQKAKKVMPAKSMDEHNAELREIADSDEPVTEVAVAELTTAQVADALDTDARTLRKFLRSKASGVDPVGQGKRYALSAQSLPKLAAKFDKWAKRDAEGSEPEDHEVDPTDGEGEDSDVLSYTADELDEMTVKELRALGAEYQIDIPTKAKKAEIVALLADA